MATTTEISMKNAKLLLDLYTEACVLEKLTKLPVKKALRVVDLLHSWNYGEWTRGSRVDLSSKQISKYKDFLVETYDDLLTDFNVSRENIVMQRLSYGMGC